MATTDEGLAHEVRPVGHPVILALTIGLTVPAVVLRLAHVALPDPVEALLFGLAIVGSAFLLSWAAEVAQLDISAGLAISVVALIAVLPEYAVDAVFAIKGGRSVRANGPSCPSDIGGESPCTLALANMTGGNRLLIGVGWTLVAYIAFWQWRRRGVRRNHITLARSHSVELSYLVLATAYSFTLPLKSSITLVDTAVLVAIFGAYTLRISRAPATEPELVGPAAWMGTFPAWRRRAVVVLLLVLASGVILLCAEPFAEALVDTGQVLRLNEFLLVQWLAPLASESPELLVAGLYAWRLNTANGLGTLVSSKVNQWTLLVGTLPVAFAITSHSWHGLPIIAFQREELLLTAAQSLFAAAVLASLSLSMREANLLLGLFTFQFVASAVAPGHLRDAVLLGTSAVYVLLAVYVLASDRYRLPGLLKDGFVTPYSELADNEK